MPDEITIEEEVQEEEGQNTGVTIPDEPPKGWLEKIGVAVTNALKSSQDEGAEEDAAKSAPTPKDIAAAAKMLGTTPAKLSLAMQGMTEEEEEDEAGVKGKGGKTRKSDAQGPEEDKVAKTNVVATEALLKAHLTGIEAKYQGLLDDVQKAQAELKGENDSLREEVSKLRSEADGSKASLRKSQMVRKAETLMRLPVSSTDLAEILIKAQDGMPDEDYAKLEALLGAADRQLYQSSLYAEIGSARTPAQVAIEDAVAKAAKEKDVTFEEALMDLPPEKQAELLKEWDEQTPGGER